jgi:heterodisulfide reductase subunit B
MSCRAVFNALGINLIELEDWNCCGATFYMSIDEITSIAVAARNLAIAERYNLELIAPCSSCFTILSKANRFLKNNEKLYLSVNKVLKEIGLEYKLTVRIRHPLDVLVNDIGFEIIKMKIKKSLKGLRIANYYGCQIVRPDKLFDDRENPTSMDNLFELLGAESVYYPVKVKCCGGMLTTIKEEITKDLIFEILYRAKENKADLIVTTCPLCQMNLEAYQKKIENKFNEKIQIPVYYFTQVLGISLGLSEEDLGLNKNFMVSDKLYKILKEVPVENL